MIHPCPIVLNRRIVLARRPEGRVREADFRAEEVSLKPLEAGQARAQVLVLGIDPTIRTWLSEAKSYLPPVQLGEVVRSGGAGRIVETRCERFKVGDLVTCLTGWQEYTTVTDDAFVTTFPSDTPPKLAVGALGSNGMAAYVGMLDIGRPKKDEVVVVSGAAGSTGSLAGQLAKMAGVRVVGIAGSDQKCEYVVERLGFSACVNYKRDDFRAALREACGRPVDVYFDNVGGAILNEVLSAINVGARIALCGAISVYNEATKPPGPANYLNLISRRAEMRGFNGMDHWSRHAEISAQLRAWIDRGDLVTDEHVIDGLDHAWRAVNALFDGDNFGKVVVRVAGD